MNSLCENEGADESRRSATRGGMLVVVSSPSGGGKGTLIRRALEIVPNLDYSVSYTTRLPRPGEVNGRDYYFVAKEEFERMRVGGEFLESACVHGNFYGTACAEVERATASGQDVILEIDVQGAASVAERAREAASVFIFILPPSFDELARRLSARGTENQSDLQARLKNSRGEVERYTEFDYVVLNDEAQRASKELAAIVLAERARRERQIELAKRVLATFPQNF